MISSLVINEFVLPFFFSNGNDDIDVFYHENNITASSI